MARVLGRALALAAALCAAPASAIVVRDLPSAAEAANATTTKARRPSPEQLIKVAKALKVSSNGTFDAAAEQLIKDAQALEVSSNGTFNATLNASVLPFVATSVQLALTAVVDPVAQTCKEIQRWVYFKMVDLQEAVNQTKAFPDKVLEVFAMRFAVLFKYVQEKLSIMTNKLESVTEGLKGVKSLISQLGFDGALANVEKVIDSMALRVNKYTETLTNSTEVANSLRNMTKSDWKEAGKKLHKLKIYLDSGAKSVRQFGESLDHRVEQAIEFLAARLHTAPEKFSPFREGVNASWVDLEDSTDKMRFGLQSAAQMLPPEIAMALPEESGARSRGLVGAAAMALVAAVAF